MEKAKLHLHEQEALIMLPVFSILLLDTLPLAEGFFKSFSPKKEQVYKAALIKAKFIREKAITENTREVIETIAEQLKPLIHKDGLQPLIWTYVFEFERYFEDLRRIFLVKSNGLQTKLPTWSANEIYSFKKKFKFVEDEKLSNKFYEIKKSLEFK